MGDALKTGTTSTGPWIVLNYITLAKTKFESSDRENMFEELRINEI